MKVFGVRVHLDWVAVILAGMAVVLIKIGVITRVPW